MNLDKLTKEYYEGFDLEILQNKLNFLANKLTKLKSEKYKKIYYTEIYATYLQIVEIFCINTFAVSDNELIGNIFLNNFQIQQKIKERFYEQINNEGEDFISYLLNKLVFAKKDETKDRTQQKSIYKRMTKESIEDYLKDKDFLNSYKHGFRVFSNESTSISIGPTGGKNLFKLQDFSSSISYYTKDTAENIILKCSVSFNWERVYVKASILINILENMKKVYLSNGNKMKFSFITFKDINKLDSKFGCFRICHKVAILGK